MANITGTNGKDTLTGTATDDTINALGGNDRIIGSLGIDTIDGGAGNDTLDFSNIGKGIFLSYTGTFLADVERTFRTDPSNITISTTISNVETIIGDPSKSNTINDFSPFPVGTGVVDVNLSTGGVVYTSTAYSQAYPSTSFTVKNFDNIRLINSSGRFVGNNMGDKNGAYYVGHGNNDYALITDFDLTKDSIDLGGFKNYSFALEGNNTIDLYSGKDVNHRDLIAKIHITGGISTGGTNAKSVMGADGNLNAIVHKIDIISG